MPALAKTEKSVIRYDKPEGYNYNDYQKLIEFFEQEDECGESNGSVFRFRKTMAMYAI